MQAIRDPKWQYNTTRFNDWFWQGNHDASTKKGVTVCVIKTTYEIRGAGNRIEKK